LQVGLSFTLDQTNYPNSASYLYGFVLELCEEAERLGIDSLWFSEHHAWGVGHLAQPLTYCAAVAARTSRVRVGTAITVASLRHPAHLAEEAAVVDLVSGGRLELGLGAGYYVREFEMFGSDMKRRFDLLDERVRQIRALWAEGALDPVPVQEPFTIWMGYQGPKGAYRAGLLGEALLSADGQHWEPYREGLVAGGHDVAKARMCGALTAWITEDPERDWPDVSVNVAKRFDGYRRRFVEGRDLPEPPPVDPERLRGDRMGRKHLGAFMHATPEDAAEGIAAFVGHAPVEEVHFDAVIGTISEARIVEQMRTVCTRLAPLLRDHVLAAAAQS
jgi:alkanesulfonate monooxygenase SsuD/methylene tetrahydromethanopterin reductase-like flavin-dependent oxidoreductase (luciferase family)